MNLNELTVLLPLHTDKETHLMAAVNIPYFLGLVMWFLGTFFLIYLFLIGG